jgi:hypothetical protein
MTNDKRIFGLSAQPANSSSFVQEGRIKKKNALVSDIDTEVAKLTKLIDIVKPALTGLQTETRLSRAFVSRRRLNTA